MAVALGSVNRSRSARRALSAAELQLAAVRREPDEVKVALARVGGETILADAVGVGVLGLHRRNARCAQFGRFFNDKIGARLFDRREQQP